MLEVIGSDGSLGNSQTFSWDLTQGKPGASISAPTPSTTAGNTAPNSNLDYFLAVDGIDGQSLNRTHQNWFEISNYDFSALMSTTGSPTFSPLTVTLDASGLTGLLADLPTSTPIKSVRLEAVTRGTNPQAVYDLTLGNVRVSDYEDTSSGDTLSFTYQQVDLTTTAINPDGSRGGSQTFSWDTLNNVPGTHPVSAPAPGTTTGELAGPDARYFLAIDGINGGATDVNHVGWFDVSSYDFGAQIASLAMGLKPTFSPLTVTLPLPVRQGFWPASSRTRHSRRRPSPFPPSQSSGWSLKASPAMARRSMTWLSAMSRSPATTTRRAETS